MQNPSREMVLVPRAARTTDSTSTDIVLPDAYTAAIVKLEVHDTPTGTTPTLNVYVQQKLPTAATADAAQAVPTGTAAYDDFISFTQVTATGYRTARVVGGGNVEAASSDGALAAGVRNGPLGRVWRVKWDVGGTSPSFDFSVVAQFIP